MLAFKRDTSAMQRLRRRRVCEDPVPTKLAWEKRKDDHDHPAARQPPSRRKRAAGKFPAVPNNCFIVPKTLKPELRKKLDQIIWWFKEDRLRDVVAPLIRRTRPAIDTPGGEKLSIRLMSWGLVNYSKENAHLCDYPWTNPETGERTVINVRQVQEMISATNSRDSFAPHRRSALIHIKVDGDIINTAFEQVNFFFLLGYFNYIEWAIDHKREIREHMDRCMQRTQQLRTQAKECGVKFKRRALCGQGHATGTAVQLPHDEEKAEVLKRIMEQMNANPDFIQVADADGSDGASL